MAQQNHRTDMPMRCPYGGGDFSEKPRAVVGFPESHLGQWPCVHSHHNGEILRLHYDSDYTWEFRRSAEAANHTASFWGSRHNHCLHTETATNVLGEHCPLSLHACKENMNGEIPTDFALTSALRSRSAGVAKLYRMSTWLDHCDTWRNALVRAPMSFPQSSILAMKEHASTFFVG